MQQEWTCGVYLLVNPSRLSKVNLLHLGNSDVARMDFDFMDRMLKGRSETGLPSLTKGSEMLISSAKHDILDGDAF